MWHKASTLAEGGPRRRPTFAATVAVGLLAIAAFAPGANASQPVPQALNPPPADYYTCSATGDGTICRATTSEYYGPDPTGISCGSGTGAFEVMDQATRTIDATRWYDEDGNLVRRWELKFLWFNPMWAVLTIACGLVLILAAIADERIPVTDRANGRAILQSS
jgi:hypothetical protein